MPTIAAVLSQVPDPVLSGLASGGVIGCVIAALFAIIWKKMAQDVVREERRDVLLERLTLAVNGLILATTAEVLTRPDVKERTRSEMRELAANANAKGHG